MFFSEPFFLSYIHVGGSCQDFGYEGNEGPTHWGDKYEECVGKHQSPIDIDSIYVKTKDFPPLIFYGFGDIMEEVSLENNGHTVMLKITNDEIPTVQGGPLQDIYGFAQLHFHWGPNDTLGSENLINHHSFPLELHMVMYNKKYQDMTAAVNYKDGVTVLSFLYSAMIKDNSNYEQFENGLAMVKKTLATIDIKNFVSLDDFTTTDRDTYFTYEGSLTTPPCAEVVTWIEFSNTIPLSKDQIKTFRTLVSSQGGNLTQNFRPVQPLYDRIIYRNVAANHKPTELLILFLGLLSILKKFSYYVNNWF